MITTNIKPITYHNYSGNITTQSQRHISSGMMGSDGETDPLFRASPAATITYEDIALWNSGGSIDWNSYVTHDYLSAQAYLTGTELANMGYISAEILTEQSYITTNDLNSRSYVTRNEIDSAGYITPEVLAAQSYLTVELEPAFNASPAAGITDEDISRWNEGVPIEMSSYVTHDFLSSQAYLTTELEPAFNSSPASSITSTDISNWNNAAGTLDMSAYCTKAELAAQAYITSNQLANCGYVSQNDIVFPDYSATYQSAGDYVTPSQLAAQGYISSESDPIFSASPAAGISTQDIEKWNSGGSVELGAYVKKSELSEQAYITSSALAGMSYITQSDIVFPDYSSTYQVTGDYVSKSQLSDQSYVRFYAYTENNKTILYDGSLAVMSKMYQNTYTGTPIHSSVSIETQDRYGRCTAGIQSHISYNGTTYTAETNFSAIAPVNGESRAKFSADYIDLVAGNTLTIRNQDGTYRCGISFSSFDGKLMLFPSNGISLQYKGAQSFIASYTYVLEQMNDFVVSQAYITPSAIAAMAYVTQSNIVFPDYSNTYQVKGDYVTPTELVSQSYITLNDVTFPDYSNTYQTKGDYVTPTQLVNQSYVTKSDLSAQSYVTQSTVVFPDYQNTYQSKGDYVTPTQLVGQSYVTTNDLVSQSYITTSELVSQSYVTATQLVSQSYITPAQLVSQSYVTTNDLVSQSYATKSYVANYVEDAIHEPEVVWETNGVGLTALETNMSASPAWQLTDLDMTPYKHIKIYSRSNQKTGTTASASTTAAMVLEMSLDPRAAGPYGGHYIGSTVSQKPNDSNRLATLTCAVSADKTSFAVLRMTSLYGTAATGNSDVNAYVFKIVGYYDEIGGIDTSGDLSDYVSKVELSQQSYITSTTLSNQSYITSTSLQNMSYVTTTDLSNCGYVQIQLVTRSQYVDRMDNILYIITDAPPIS